MLEKSIVFSPANLDSCLAAAISVEIGKVSEDVNVVTYPYSRGSEFNNLPKNPAYLEILGADLSNDDLSSLLRDTSPKAINLEAYRSSTVYTEKIIKELNNRGANYSRYKLHSDDVSHNSDPSIAMKTFRECSYEINSEIAITSVIELASIVSRFNNFETITKPESLFLFENIGTIRKAAIAGKKGSLTLKQADDDTEARYASYMHDLKIVIQDNLSQMHYAGANGSSFITPTLNITERDAYHAMRFISYAYSEMISFEDKKSHRVYRIHSDKNIPWYVKRFQPIDIWSEGTLVYLKTELPRHMS